MANKDFVENKVAQYRQKKGLTQEELALAVGVTRQTIVAIEKGNYTPSVLLAMRIAHYFKVPTDVIFLIP